MDESATSLMRGAIADLEFGYDSRLRYLPLQDAGIAINEYVVCLGERRRTPMIADFLRCAADAFQPADTVGRSGPEAA